MRATDAWARMLAALGAVVAVDQVTKQIAVTSLERGESVNVFLAVDLTHVRNSGVAFGAFEGGGAALVAFAVLALVLLLGWFALNATRRLLWLPVALVVGGAAGNVADRVREGSVIDFIDPIAWPAFNLADVAIVAGVLGILYVAEGSR